MQKIRYWSLLVLIAFVMNAVVPFFAVYNPSGEHNDTTRLSSVFGESVLLCTGDGFKWVKLADLQSGKEKPKQHSGDKCPLCYAARHGMKSIIIATAFIVHDFRQHYPPLFVFSDSTLIPSIPASPLNMRAPPVSFIG